MKIVEVIPQLASGGAERFIVDLSNELVAQGHEVVLVSLFSLDDEAGLNFYLKQLSRNVKTVSLYKQPGFDIKMYGRLTGLIKKERPDVVHSHLRSLPYLVPSMLITRKSRYFHTIHNDAKIEASDLINRLSRKMVFKTGLCHAVTISAESNLSFSRYYGKAIDRTMIPNGSPAALTDIKQAPEITDAKAAGHTTIVNVARVTRQKNQLALVKAMKNLPDVELFIIGDDSGDYAGEVKDAAPSNVRFLNQRKNPRDYMAAADAFILPSLFEGMPISLIECFSVGAIPIVTSVGGMKNMVVDGHNGIIIKDTSTESITQAIRDFIALDNDRREKLSKNSAHSFCDYEIGRCARSYINLFMSKS